jgi:hypothetical protein
MNHLSRSHSDVHEGHIKRVSRVRRPRRVERSFISQGHMKRVLVIWRDGEYLLSSVIMCILCTETLEELYVQSEIYISRCDKNRDFPFLPNLKLLSIESSSIVFIHSLPELEYLDICDSNIVLLPEFPKLRDLKLQTCNNLNNIPFYPALERWILIDTSISNVPESMFEADFHIENCPMLYVPVKVQGKMWCSLLWEQIRNISEQLQDVNFVLKLQCDLWMV